MKKFTILIATLIIISGCTSAEEAYRQTKTVDTISAYEKYIKKYPDSDFADKSKNRIYELEFDSVQKIDTISAYENYIKKYPASHDVDSAKNRIERLNCKTCCDNVSYEFDDRNNKGRWKYYASKNGQKKHFVGELLCQRSDWKRNVDGSYRVYHSGEWICDSHTFYPNGVGFISFNYFSSNRSDARSWVYKNGCPNR